MATSKAEPTARRISNTRPGPALRSDRRCQPRRAAIHQIGSHGARSDTTATASRPRTHWSATDRTTSKARPSTASTPWWSAGATAPTTFWRHPPRPRTWRRCRTAEVPVSDVLRDVRVHGNICRSPMAERCSPTRSPERGLAGVVRVTSAGTGGWRVGDGADERANQVLRRHGYPTDHRAAQVGRRTWPRASSSRSAETTLRMLGELGVEPGRLRMLRSFDPAIRRPRPRRRRPLLRRHRRLRRDLHRDRGSPARPACMGRRTASATKDAQADATLASAVPTRLAGLAVAVVAFAYLCFTVLAPWQLGRNTKTSREEQPDRTSLNAAPIPVTEACPAGFVRSRSAVAAGHRDEHHLPAAQVVARLRMVDGEPAFQVLTPFRSRRRSHGPG